MKLLRPILAAFGLASAAKSSEVGQSPHVNPDTAKICPYVVPAGYLEVLTDESRTIPWPLGHGLHVMLVHDLPNLVRNVTPAELSGMGLNLEQAKKRSIENLSKLFKSGEIKASRFNGPDGKPFILMGGHWATATCILLPDLHKFAATNLGAKELCVSIPHREAMLIFPKGDKAYRDTMRQMIREKESDGRKPLSFELFTLTAEGLAELKE